MVYEGPSSKEILTKELFKRHGNELRRRLDAEHNEDEEIIQGYINLKDCMEKYSEQEFIKDHGFAFSRTSKPQNTKAGGKVAAYDALFDLPSFPASRPDVDSRIDSELFR